MNGRCKRLIGMCVAFASAVALADWDDGDGAVMAPQLPTGVWNVNVDDVTPKPQLLADDWYAAYDAQVTDAHLWVSWNGEADVASAITQVHLAIYEDGVYPDADPQSAGTFHAPGERLWSGNFFPGTAADDFQVRLDPAYATTPGGWYDPWDGEEGTNHVGIYQINIEDLVGVIEDPGEEGYFQQEARATYWLSVVVDVEENGLQLGWHTSNSAYVPPPPALNAGAVYNANAFTTNPGVANWQPLLVPADGVRVDMAFVMTPEPGGLGLLALGGASLAMGRRRRTAVAS